MLNSWRNPRFARCARFARFVSAGLAAAAVLAACGTDSAETTVATVDGVPVTLDDLNSGPNPPTPGAGSGTLSKASIATSASAFIQQQGAGTEVDVESEFGFWDEGVGAVRPTVARFSGPAAVVNGTAISAEDVFFELDEEASFQAAQGAPPSLVDPETGRVSVVDAGQIVGGMINAQLVREGLAERDLEVTDELREEIRVSLGPVPEGMSQQFADLFIQRQAEFQLLATDLTPPTPEIEPFTAETLPPCARHILVATDDEAQMILDSLDAGEDFAALAAQLSIDTVSGPAGGVLGCVPVDVYVPEFGSALVALAEGERSGPVTSEFGVHIIERLEATEADLAQANQTRQAQADQTADQNGQSALQAWFNETVGEADIELDPRLGTWDPGLGVTAPQ